MRLLVIFSLLLFFFTEEARQVKTYVVHKLKMVFRTVRQSKQMSSKNPQKRFSKCKTFIWWMFLYVHISWRKKWVDLGSYWILVIFHSNKQTSYKYFNDSNQFKLISCNYFKKYVTKKFEQTILSCPNTTWSHATLQIVSKANRLTLVSTLTSEETWAEMRKLGVLTLNWCRSVMFVMLAYIRWV